VSFLNPWWALGIAAAVIPALLILYFLKLRRREQLVASTLLWKRAVQDLQVNAPFQRLRKNLLLLLQLLVLGLAIFALARPMIETTAATEGRLVILVDRSASMNAKEEDGSRLELAKEQAVRLVKTLNRRSGGWLSFFRLGGAEAKTQAMVIGFSDRASVIAPFTPNTGELLDAIGGIQPTDGQTDIREALELAAAYTAPPTMTTDKTPVSAESAARIVLLSDGAVRDLTNVVLREGQIELRAVGETHDNVGITALRARRNYEQPETLEVFLQVQNFGDKPVTTDVSLLIDGELANADVRTLTLDPAPSLTPPQPGTPAPAEGTTAVANTRGLSFELTLDRAATLEARLSRRDALEADNRALAVIPPPRRLRVLVVTEQNLFLDSVLSGLPLAERIFMTPAQYERAPAAQLAVEGRSTFDVVIFDKYQPGPLPVGNYLFIGAVPKVEGINVAEELDRTYPLVWWDDTHAVLRHVALDYVYASKGLVLELPSDAETLIEGPAGPALARYRKDGRHYMILSFPLEYSNWWSKPGFPVFAYNVLRYLGAGGAEAEGGPVRPGETLRIVLPEGTDKAELVRPDGTTLTLQPDVAGVVYFGGTHAAGVYRVRYTHGGEQHEDRYAVNLEDAWESDIRPRTAGDIGSAQVVAGQTIDTATPEIWRWFVGAALALVLLEWYIYNRRVMI
jgi:hypothetical protein